MYVLLYSTLDVPPSPHAFVDGHLSCLHLWAIVNNAAMNLAMQMSVWVPAFSPLGVSTQKWNC